MAPTYPLRVPVKSTFTLGMGFPSSLFLIVVELVLGPSDCAAGAIAPKLEHTQQKVSIGAPTRLVLQMLSG